MDIFDFRVTAIIGMAASVAACNQLCFDRYLETARKSGVPERAIRAAISIAKSVRKTGQRNMDDHLREKLSMHKFGQHPVR